MSGLKQMFNTVYPLACLPWPFIFENPRLFKDSMGANVEGSRKAPARRAHRRKVSPLTHDDITVKIAELDKVVQQLTNKKKEMDMKLKKFETLFLLAEDNEATLRTATSAAVKFWVRLLDKMDKAKSEKAEKDSMRRRSIPSSG